MSKEEQYDLIERYLNDQLTAAEQLAFQNKLEGDADFKAEVSLHRELANVIKGKRKQMLRDQLKVVDQNWKSPETQTEAKIRPFNFRRWGAIAAAIALLVLSYFVFLPNRPSNQQLFAANFESYPMVLNERNGNEIDSLLQVAITAYEKGKFATAVQLFQQLQTKDAGAQVYVFYEGLSLLESQQLEAAAAIFTKIVNTSDPRFAEQSRWYLALTYLQMNQIEQAKKELSQIEKGQYQFQKAQELLAKL